MTHTGDILPDPAAGTLTIRLDPIPTVRETTAIAQFYEHLTATATTYPWHRLALRYQFKNRPRPQQTSAPRGESLTHKRT